MAFPNLPATMPDRQAEERWEGEGGAMLPDRPWVVRRRLQMKFYDELIEYIRGEFITEIIPKMDGIFAGGFMHTGKGGGFVRPGVHLHGGTITGRMFRPAEFNTERYMPRHSPAMQRDLAALEHRIEIANYSQIEKRIIAKSPALAMPYESGEVVEGDIYALAARELAETSQVDEKSISMQLRQLGSSGVLSAKELRKQLQPWWRRALDWLLNLWRH